MSAEVIEASKPDDRSVGVVRTQTVSLFNKPNVLETEGGATLSPINVAYETYGTLSEKRDNAIFVCHALTGDAHAAGFRTEEEMAENKKPGWWDGLIGPGKGLDTNKYFVICANVLGGCQGTTGPKDINPETGQPYGQDFPVITVGDIVKVHSQLVSHLGIDKLLGAIGGSLGGMQVLEWGYYEGFVRALVPIAVGGRHSAWCIAWGEAQRQAIYADPNWKNGHYSPDSPPAAGLATARMMAMVSYRSMPSFREKFARTEMAANDGDQVFSVESYLRYQGDKLVGRFDPNCYVHLTRQMDSHDVARGRGAYPDVLRQLKQPTLVVGIESDVLYSLPEQEELVNHIPHASLQLLPSIHGHDAFLIELDTLNDIVGNWMKDQVTSDKSETTLAIYP